MASVVVVLLENAVQNRGNLSPVPKKKFRSR
jgi:hypothetical protein